MALLVEPLWIFGVLLEASYWVSEGDRCGREGGSAKRGGGRGASFRKRNAPQRAFALRKFYSRDVTGSGACTSPRSQTGGYSLQASIDQEIAVEKVAPGARRSGERRGTGPQPPRGQKQGSRRYFFNSGGNLIWAL